MNVTGKTCRIVVLLVVLSPLLFFVEVPLGTSNTQCYVSTQNYEAKSDLITAECPKCECNSPPDGKLGHYKVALLIMMTGKYIRYFEGLKSTFDIHFLSRKTEKESYKLHYFIFTDGELSKTDDVTPIFQKRLGWPFDSMMRFEIYYNSSSLYEHMDYIFSVDADLKAVNEVKPETILSELTGTRHPGYPYKQNARSLPYDNHVNSGSYIGDDEEGYYYFGAFWGGKSNKVLQMCKTIRRRIWADLTNNVMPAWHDESHLNRYMMDNPPGITLEAGYVTAEGAYGGSTSIIQLNKNRQQMTDCASAQHVCKINK